MAADFTSVEPNQVHLGDCISFLDKVAALHSEGLFDLAFADPPYNLQKLYGNYADALAEKSYIEWCNRWLDGMARALDRLAAAPAALDEAKATASRLARTRYNWDVEKQNLLTSVATAFDRRGQERA